MVQHEKRGPHERYAAIHGDDLPRRRRLRALCPELDVASQGESVEEASANLREAVELFFETADPSEIAARTRGELYVAALEVRAGRLRVFSGSEVCTLSLLRARRAGAVDLAVPAAPLALVD
jgi:hypothetical protein